MNSDIWASQNSGVELNRDNFINLLRKALEEGNVRFVKQASSFWLEKYPNDLLILCIHAKSLFIENEFVKANEIIKQLCDRDPEFLEAWEIRSQFIKLQEIPATIDIGSHIYALGGKVPKGLEVSQWSKDIKACNDLLANDELEKSKELLLSALSLNVQVDLLAINHLRSIKNEQDQISFLRLAKIYHQRWPECLQISLLLADAEIEIGEEIKGVALLHDCSSKDIAEQVALRLWGKDHEYSSIWPSDLKFNLPIQIPSQLAIPLGWNQLNEGEKQSVPAASNKKQHLNLKSSSLINKVEKSNNLSSMAENSDFNTLSEIENEYKSITEKINKPEIKTIDGRLPIYVILTTKKGLLSQYGEKSAEVIFDCIKKMTDALNLRKGWQAIAFYPDDINCTRMFEIDPVTVIDPWKIKLTLVDLDKYLRKKGQMIGCVLIIGSHEVVPFHALPNPTNDKDQEILSDNPYATLDSNYFVPEWPIGRLPGENNNDPGLILKQMRQIIENHQNQQSNLPWWNRVSVLFNSSTNLINLMNGFISKTPDFGYSAAVWRRSSLATFRPIGSGNYLKVSPPFNSNTIEFDQIIKAKNAYFNLHGLPDSSDWYGQRDMSDPVSTPDFPVALSTQQFNKTESSPEIIYSEACYGAFIQNKTIDQSLALKFKDKGALAFIGSTCIAYGSVVTPLIGADLLGFLFWKLIKEGYSVGESFTQAKIGLAKLMTQRQGYLDGEDQKTLISFVLYGDPLSSTSEIKQSNQIKTLRQRKAMKILAYNDRSDLCQKEVRISGEILKELRTTLGEYLPGIENANLSIQRHNVPAHQTSESANNKNAPKPTGVSFNRFKITYFSEFSNHQKVHPQYARVTLDEQGKLIKLAVSR